MTDQTRITLNADALAEKIAQDQNKENKRNVLTRSQAHLLDIRTKLDDTRTEMIELSSELEKNERAKQALDNLVNGQRKNLADLTAHYRANLEAAHRLEMDGVFLSPPKDGDGDGDGTNGESNG